LILFSFASSLDFLLNLSSSLQILLSGYQSIKNGVVGRRLQEKIEPSRQVVSKFPVATK
jgi:hypothetical protein